MRIKFLINSPRWGSDGGSGKNSPQCFINCAMFFIKHFYDLKGRSQDIEWLMADLVMHQTVEQQIQEIKLADPDVLALSVYAWNESRQYAIGQAMRAHNPDCVIVMGGPQLTAHKDPDFFDRFPWVDYVVYGDGERAFQQIVDHELGLIDRSGFVNIVSNNQGSATLYPYERFVDEDFWTSSPYLGQQQIIRQHIDYLEHQVGIPRSGIMACIEFARGCMYNCSFCDWSQNLTKKVKRRKSNWQEEIDFFCDLDIMIRETDANWGQWAEDREIYDYAASLYDPERNFKFVAWNMAKIKKTDVPHFLVTNHRLFGSYMDLSFQDIDVEVLKNIDRPSLTWDEQKEMIQYLRSQFDYDIGPYLRAQLMIGLPGQTYEQFVDTMHRIWHEAKVYNYEIFQWRILPNSPGADPFYQRLHGIKCAPAWFLSGSSVAAEDLQTLYQRVSFDSSTQIDFYESTTVFSTATMTFAEIMAVMMLQDQLKKLGSIKNPDSIANTDVLFQKLSEKCLDSAQKQWQIIEPLYDRYGFLLNGTYDPRSRIFLPVFAVY